MRALTLTTIAAFGLIVSLAWAEEVTRAEYVARVEPICKVNAKANERILKNVRKEVKQGKLALAGRQFIKAAKALKKTYLELKAVPQPTADQARLTKWLGYVKTEVTLFEEAGKALKAGKKNK